MSLAETNLEHPKSPLVSCKLSEDVNMKIYNLAWSEKRSKNEVILILTMALPDWCVTVKVHTKKCVICSDNGRLLLNGGVEILRQTRLQDILHQ